MGHNSNTGPWGCISNGASVGIDGARGGWVCASLEGDDVRLHFAPSLGADMWGAQDTILIDMPIGFPGRGTRRCDLDAAAFLGSRRSTIFHVPCRAAVEAPSYAEACERNSLSQGKRVSIQLWNIVPKMRELDVLLAQSPGLHARLAEGHPEVAFAILSPEDAPLPSKRLPAGREARLNILTRYLGSRMQAALEEFERSFRSARAVGDAIDAAALACLVRTHRGSISFFGDGAVDESGAPMRIATVRA